MARPRFMPSVEQRRLVRSLAACGIRQEEIAHYLGLRSVKTLRRHFREELGRAAVEATAAGGADLISAGDFRQEHGGHDLLAQDAGEMARYGS
jgi:hypothetical protein